MALSSESADLANDAPRDYSCAGCPFEADTPPSTAILAHVTKLASSLARNTITDATSSGSQIRPKPDALLEFRDQLFILQHIFCHAGSGQAGADRVYADAVLAKIQRQARARFTTAPFAAL
jgi:hypothetical protein